MFFGIYGYTSLGEVGASAEWLGLTGNLDFTNVFNDDKGWLS